MKENKTSLIDKNLEESWTSLNLFNRIQRGRLLETRDGSGIQGNNIEKVITFK